MFAQQCDLNAHYNAAHLVEPSNCEVCDKKFDNRTKLKAHVRAVHSREEEGQLQEWECPICHKVLRSKKINQSRSQHLETHEEKKYKCEFCPKTFRLKISYDGHINEHKGIYEHKCQPCNKVTFNFPLFKNEISRPFDLTLCSTNISKRQSRIEMRTKLENPVCFIKTVHINNQIIGMIVAYFNFIF